MYRLLQPVESRLVPDPASGAPLPPEGLQVRITAYWRRRLGEGVVRLVGEPGLSGSVVPIVVPEGWRELPWTQRAGDGPSLRSIAASLSATPIITRDDAVAAIEAELARRSEET